MKPLHRLLPAAAMLVGVVAHAQQRPPTIPPSSYTPGGHKLARLGAGDPAREPARTSN